MNQVLPANNTAIPSSLAERMKFAFSQGAAASAHFGGRCKTGQPDLVDLCWAPQALWRQRLLKVHDVQILPETSHLAGNTSLRRVAMATPGLIVGNKQPWSGLHGDRLASQAL